MCSSDVVFQPVGAKTAAIAVVLQAGMPNVRMQRPCAKAERAVPAPAAQATARSRSRRENR